MVNSQVHHLGSRKSVRRFRKTAKHTGMLCEVRSSQITCTIHYAHSSIAAMTSAQARIGETLSLFYGGPDQNSDGAMAEHAYKRSVDDMDSAFTRELVRHLVSSGIVLLNPRYATNRKFPTEHVFLNLPGRCAPTSLSSTSISRSETRRFDCSLRR